MHLMQIDDKEIRELEKNGLTRLAHRLLMCVAIENKIPEHAVTCTFNIDTGDGGEDASIRWAGLSDTNGYVDPDTLLQVKATRMPVSECGKEILNKSGKELKPNIKDLFERKGTYILFCNRDAKGDQVDAILQVAKAHGFPDAKIRAYNPRKIADWVSKYISAVTLVKELNQRPMPLGIETWQNWKDGAEHAKTEFVSEPVLDNYMVVLRAAALKPGTVVRMCGLPGLGKSRLAIEALAEPSINKFVGFIDATTDSGQLGPQLTSLINSGISGSIVIDNCPPILHNVLKTVIERKNSKCSLITMDADPDEVRGHEYIELAPLLTKTIEAIIRKQYPDMSDQDLQHIARLAEGYPQMAALMCDAGLRDTGNLSQITPKDLVNRLLFGRAEVNKQERQVISACSLFEKFAFDDGDEGETELIAKLLCPEVTVHEFGRIVAHFKKRHILEPHMGAFTKVTPRPLAWRLASDWWDSCTNKLVDLLLNGKWPDSLAQAMCEQLTFLRDTDAAHRVAEKLCRPDCPFVSAEHLNTKRGSQLFCAMVEVSPDVTLGALERTYLKATKDELLSVIEGRRYLVWALGKLCWESAEFERAAFLLYRFADAENENRISNNATGDLKQLFHIQLPGTKANLNQRLQVLDEILRVGGENELSMKCLCAALTFGPFGRVSGVERQGGKLPENDYVPTNSEVRNYWHQIIQRLLPFLEKDQVREQVLEHFARSLLYLVRHRMLGELSQIVSFKVAKVPSFWVEGLESLNMALRVERDRLSAEEIEEVEACIAKLQPSTFAERYKLIVAEASYSNFGHDADGNIVPVNDERAETFGRESGLVWRDWIDQLDVLLSGEQREVHAFARGLVQTLDDPKFVIERCMEFIGTNSEANPAFLGELGAALTPSSPEITDNLLNELEHRADTIKFAPWLLYRIGVDDSTLDRYTRMLSAGRMALDGLGSLKYGGVLHNVSATKFREFLSTIVGPPPSDAKNQCLALQLLRAFSYGDNEHWEAVKDIARAILVTPGFLKSIPTSGMLLHDWQDCATYFLQHDDKELAVAVSYEIVSICSDSDTRTIHSMDHYLQPVLSILLKTYFKECWDIIGGALESSDWHTVWNMKHMLSNKFEVGESPQPIFEAPEELLADWCDAHEQAALKLVESVQLWNVTDKGSVSLSRLGERLLAQYGNHKDFLQRFVISLGYISVRGSMADLFPQYNDRLLLMKLLATHKHAAVRKWAAGQIKYYEKALKQAEKRLEEEQHGILGGFLRGF